MIGTLRYAAPERLLGDAVTPRTDVWALGAVLYEMLTGSPAVANADLSGALDASRAAPPSLDGLPPDLAPGRRTGDVERSGGPLRGRRRAPRGDARRGGAAGSGRGHDRAAGPARGPADASPRPSEVPPAVADHGAVSCRTERRLQDRCRRIAGAGRSPWCSSRRWASPLWWSSSAPTCRPGRPGRSIQSAAPLPRPRRSRRSPRDRVGPAGRARQRQGEWQGQRQGQGQGRRSRRQRELSPTRGTTRPAATCLRGRISQVG